MKNPSFTAAVYRAPAKAKAKLIRVITNAAPRDWRRAAFLLSRSWPDEYARTERIEQTDKTDEKSLPLTILYQNGDKTLAELLDFPNAETDSSEAGREKQRRLLGQTTAEAPVPRNNFRCASA
jgi:hypothetical protein